MKFGIRHFPAVAAAVLGIMCNVEALKAQSASASVRVLDNGVVSAGVMVPGHPQRYNRGARFTEVAAVLSARICGHEFLYAPQDHHPVDDHGGLASEFDLVTPVDPDDLMPPGYLDAAIGGGFLKVGVGVLKKQKQRYSLFQQPEIISPAVTNVLWADDSAEFSQACSGIDGYAYELSARITLRNNNILMDWQLKNTGSKKLITRHYNHNFFRLSESEIGPGYVLKFPFDFAAGGLLPEQRQIGREIYFIKPIPTWTNLLIPFPSGYRGENVCELLYQPTGASVVCTTSIPGLFTAVHARRGFVSPEQFVLLRIDPGQKSDWRRTYTLNTGSAK